MKILLWTIGIILSIATFPLVLVILAVYCWMKVAKSLWENAL